MGAVGKECGRGRTGRRSCSRVDIGTATAAPAGSVKGGVLGWLEMLMSNTSLSKVDSRQKGFASLTGAASRKCGLSSNTPRHPLPAPVSHDAKARISHARK